MERFKAAFKAALKQAIIGLVAFLVGIILIIVGVCIENGLVPFIIAFIAIIAGICFFVWAYSAAKQRLHAICPECQEYMGNTDKDVDYSFVCNQYKENYGKGSSGGSKFLNYTFYYTCTIVCPHCGATSVFEYNVNAKTEPKANELVNNYMQNILRINK